MGKGSYMETVGIENLGTAVQNKWLLLRADASRESTHHALLLPRRTLPICLDFVLLSLRCSRSSNVSIIATFRLQA